MVLTNLISVYYKVPHFVHGGRAVDIFHLDFRRPFDIISHSILWEKLADCGLDGCTVHWARNLLDGQAREQWQMGL